MHQLKRIDKNWERRKQIWDKYNDAFKGLPVNIPNPFEKDTRHALHLYTLILDIDNLKTNRDGIIDALYKENIGTGVHFIAIHLHPYYKEKYKFRRGDFPVSEFISDRTISLPFSAKLTDKDAEDVIAAVKKVINYYS